MMAIVRSYAPQLLRSVTANPKLPEGSANMMSGTDHAKLKACVIFAPISLLLHRQLRLIFVPRLRRLRA